MTLLFGESSNLHGKSTRFYLHRRTIFKTSALEQLVGKWPFGAGRESSGRSDPLGDGPVTVGPYMQVIFGNDEETLFETATSDGSIQNLGVIRWLVASSRSPSLHVIYSLGTGRRHVMTCRRLTVREIFTHEGRFWSLQCSTFTPRNQRDFAENSRFQQPQTFLYR